MELYIIILAVLLVTVVADLHVGVANDGAMERVSGVRVLRLVRVVSNLEGLRKSARRLVAPDFMQGGSSTVIRAGACEGER